MCMICADIGRIPSTFSTPSVPTLYGKWIKHFPPHKSSSHKYLGVNGEEERLKFIMVACVVNK